MLKITAIGNLTNDVELKVNETPESPTPSCVSPRTAATGTGTATGSPTLSPSRYAALWRSAVRSSPGRAASWPR